jgi:methylmalonyl-CoA/ethylmalonyl-CoA epimerase
VEFASLVPGSSRVPFEVLGLQVGQVGIVVADLERSLAFHADIGPWAIWTYDQTTVSRLQIGGEPAEFAIRVALNPHAPQVELIQPLDDHSPYASWLSEHGPGGLHHLGFYVDDADRVTKAMTSAGYPPVMGGAGFGADGSGAFCYYDTIAAVGYIVEAIERPQVRRPAEATVGGP